MTERRDTEAYVESAQRRKPAKVRLLHFLMAGEGQWFTAEEIRRVAGSEATRRFRELRIYIEQSRHADRWSCEVEQVDGAWRYRMVKS